MLVLSPETRTINMCIIFNSKHVFFFVTGAIKLFFSFENQNEAVTDKWLFKNFTQIQIFGKCNPIISPD